jgi:hypothetical protein
MSDDASRRWDLDDEVLLSHFDTVYPQMQSWHPAWQLSSAVISGLCHTTLCMASAPRNWFQHKTAFGKSGVLSMTLSTLMWDSAPSKIPSQSYTPLPDAGAMAAWHPKGSRSMHVQQRKPYMWWARTFPKWGPLTSAEPTTLVIVGWKRKDPVPQRQKPVPKYVLSDVDRLACSYNQACKLKIADLMPTGFFYLLQPPG